SIGDSVFAVRAQGRFCVLAVRIKNIGDEAQTLLADNQKLLDGDLTYKASNDAWTARSDHPFLEEINPGNTVAAKIGFDVPENVTPKLAELHDSMFSEGVRIRLR